MGKTQPQPQTAYEWHVYHVYQDPEFHDMVSGLGPELLDMTGYEQIADYFAVAPEDVHWSHIGIISRLPAKLPRKSQDRYTITYEDDKQLYTVTFNGDISKREFDSIWRHIDTMRATAFITNDRREYVRPRAIATKRKPPQETGLIYAIFKVHKLHSFPAIFRMYENGNLPGYSGSTTQFTGPDSLERYYQKYRPDRHHPAT